MGAQTKILGRPRFKRNATRLGDDVMMAKAHGLMMGAAEAGDPQAMVQCAANLFAGHGCEEDQESAIELLVEAAQTGASYEGGGGDPVHQAAIARQSLAMIGLDATGQEMSKCDGDDQDGDGCDES